MAHGVDVTTHDPSDATAGSNDADRTEPTERTAIEIVFRLQEDGADYLYWVSVHGPNDGELDLSQAIDRDHLAAAKRTKYPGWVEAEPQVLMLPDPVREAVLAWALGDRRSGDSR